MWMRWIVREKGICHLQAALDTTIMLSARQPLHGEYEWEPRIYKKLWRKS